MKFTKAQQYVVNGFKENIMHDCCIHKHSKSKAWFQISHRSWFPVSDQTIKALVKKGFLYKKDDYTWRMVSSNYQTTNQHI